MLYDFQGIFCIHFSHPKDLSHHTLLKLLVDLILFIFVHFILNSIINKILNDMNSGTLNIDYNNSINVNGYFSIIFNNFLQIKRPPKVCSPSGIMYQTHLRFLILSRAPSPPVTVLLSVSVVCLFVAFSFIFHMREII